MIQVFKPSMGKEEVEAVSEVLLSGWIGLGPKTAEFEREFAKYTGVSHAVGVNSCTAALDLALRLLGISHNHEVIVPTMTFVSTAHVVAYNMATPIFADVDEKTLNVDIEDVASRITKRTRAIIPVHYGGRPVDLDALRQVAGDIPVIEDAAHACGSIYKGSKCGSLGEVGCFSFHAVKNLAMGDGGALTLNDEELALKAKRLRWLGIDKGTWDRTEVDKSYWWEYLVDEIGLKCHLNDLAAAIGLVQLRKLDAMNARRAEIAARYSEELSEIPEVEIPPPIESDSRSSWHIYCIKCKDRDALSIWLQKHGISTGVHYKPIHFYKCYGNKPVLPVAERLFKKILSLPMYPGLTDSEVETVVDAIKSFYRKK